MGDGGRVFWRRSRAGSCLSCGGPCSVGFERFFVCGVREGGSYVGGMGDRVRCCLVVNFAVEACQRNTV